MGDGTDRLADQVRTAHSESRALQIVGNGSKRFYGREPAGSELPVGEHRGIVLHDPTELVIRARAGTPLAELDEALAQHGQHLPFEPPRFGHDGTVGGCVATGLSGPRRPFAGAVRDYVLGLTLLNGRGEVLSFGGQVMKNVAGYDVSRLMAGSLGCLGVILDVSFKVLPAPAVERTFRVLSNAELALRTCSELASLPLPLSAACHLGGHLHIRLSGHPDAAAAAARRVGGDETDNAIWPALRDHELEFFEGDAPLWRLALPPATPSPALPGEWLIDWAGGQRWLRSGAPAAAVREAAVAAGGHATAFRADRDNVFSPLAAPLERLHVRLKHAFDPAGILNPGRMYPWL